MNKIKLVCAFGFLLASSVSLAASQSNLVVNTVTPGNDGILVGFSSQPSACSSSYQSHHGFISKNHKHFDEFVAAVVVYKRLKKPVKVIFQDKGSCSSASSLMLISDMK